MQVVILAGGFGTRISEESQYRPKPMVEIGGRPILWHIMKYFSCWGHNEFIICCGYKGYIIKEFFSNYLLHNSDITLELKTNLIEYHENNADDWKVTLVDTGENTMTGGRLKYIQKYINGDTFLATYGDGVSNIDISKLIKHHFYEDKIATVTAVHPPGRFGSLELSGSNVEKFTEKPLGDGAYINGGFFCLNTEVFKYIDGPETVWEAKPLEMLSQQKELTAYRHDGFWQPMDTIRDKYSLEQLWNSVQCPWKIW